MMPGRIRHNKRGKPQLYFWGKKSSKNKNCCYCQRTITGAEITKEHIIPRRVGGHLTAPCCLACNRDKGGLLLVDWALVLVKRISMLVPQGIAAIKDIKRERNRLKNCIDFLILLYPDDYDIL